MDFQIPDWIAQQLSVASDFVEKKLFPIEQEIITRDFSDAEGQLHNLRQDIKSLGLWAPHIPEYLGGCGQNLIQLGLISEVLGQSPLGHYVFGCQAPDAGNFELLHQFGTKEQKEKWMVPLAEGDIRSCFGMTEPNSAGSNPTLLETRALLDNGQWNINGRKWFTSSADGADFCILMVVTDPNAAPHKRASMIIAPTNSLGYKLVRNISVMGDIGSGYFSHAEIELKDCRLPEKNILGEIGSGFRLAQQRLGPGRIHHCMRWLGICQRALDEMINYVKTRKISSKQYLSDMQSIQNWIAESAAEIAATRSLVLQTAWKIENRGFEDSKTQVSMIKYHTANVLQKVIDRAIQSHGALGMTDDTVLAYFYRHERASRIYDGPDEVHKMLVARNLLNQ